jgi:CRISPR system Cascade subunit CasE
MSLDPLLAAVALGRVFSFKMCLNPVQATQHPEGHALLRKLERAREESDARVRGVRVAHRTAAQQMTWFLGRTATWGFDIPPLTGWLAATGDHEVAISDRRTVRFTKGGPRGRSVILTTATFVGNLVVTDPDRFASALMNGIGRGKAYGCGLVTLGPPRGAGADA